MKEKKRQPVDLWRILATVPAALIMLFTVLAPAAHAHKVSVFAWVEGNTVHTESKFSGGRHVNHGRIEVYDPQGTLLLEGRTDDQGRFSFPVPQKTDLRVELIAGTGHGNHWTIRAEELANASAGDTRTQAPAPHAAPEAVVVPRKADERTTGCDCLTAAQAQDLIRQGMERHLAPLRAQLADMAWGLRDILAGVGYILGLVGLGAYLNYRKQAKQ